MHGSKVNYHDKPCHFETEPSSSFLCCVTKESFSQPNSFIVLNKPRYRHVTETRLQAANSAGGMSRGSVKAGRVIPPDFPMRARLN